MTAPRPRPGAPERPRRRVAPVASPGRAAGAVLVHLILAVLALLFLLPLLWMLFASVDGEATLRAGLPGVLTLDNFRAVLTPEIVYRPLWNSVLTCGGAAVITAFCSVLAAYPLSVTRSCSSIPHIQLTASTAEMLVSPESTACSR